MNSYMQKLLSVQETAEVLDMHPESVRELLRRGDLVGSKMPGLRGSWKIRQSAIDNFIDGLEHQP